MEDPEHYQEHAEPEVEQEHGAPTVEQQSVTVTVSKRVFASMSNVESILGEKPLNGYLTTIIHFAKGYIATGIFAMGEGFKNSGILFGPIFLVFIGLINLNCQHILIRTLDKIEQEEGGEVKPSFAETVQYTLEISKVKLIRDISKNMGTVINIFLCGCELGFCSVYFVFIADHLSQVAAAHGIIESSNPWKVNIMLAIILIPMWASTLLSNLKLLLPLSIVANVLLWIGIIIILYYTTCTTLPPLSERPLLALETIPIYLGTAFYVFEGITMIIPLRNEMRKEEQFTSTLGVLNIGMIFVIAMNVLVGFMSYWKYGSNVKSSVFLNLEDEDKTVAEMTDILISISILFTFSLHMYIPFEITFPLFYRKYGPFNNGLLVSYIYRAVPVLITWTLANIIPFLGLFISLIGATAGAFLALIIPPILELIAFQGELSWFIVIKDGLFLVIGVSGSICGTVKTIMEIVAKFQNLM